MSLNTYSIVLIDYEDFFTWLKNQIEPEIIFHKLWNETSLHRLKLHKNDNMMNVYPALKKSTGHCLVSTINKLVRYQVFKFGTYQPK